ncbi:MAG: LysM peptidoglycan-binding domain-containing protein [Dehalococcoidia bacterium]|nr:LysM peptidoglycan-binding domain-containing protein [Dehalococcoidia bacterium]
MIRVANEIVLQWYLDVCAPPAASLRPTRRWNLTDDAVVRLQGLGRLRLKEPVSRRRFLGGALGLLGASVVGANYNLYLPGSGSGVATTEASEACGWDPNLRHMAWVWQFSEDGDADSIIERLSLYGLGVALKTHDGTDWMSTYDSSLTAITGPDQVQRMASLFEERGVPFHAWCVVKGLDPETEAAMASDVLNAGARSLILDLEAGDGFWYGTPESAMAYGNALRSLQPNASIWVSIDPRPWRASLVPLNEFASFSNGFMPQLYWDTFNSSANYAAYAASGMPAYGGLMSPEFLIDATASVLAPYGLPVIPVGQGAVSDPASFDRFIGHSQASGMRTVSVWRLGVTHPEVLPMLASRPPAHDSYVIQDGDSLSAIAYLWGTSTENVAAFNGITDPNYIQAGQTICRPM